MSKTAYISSNGFIEKINEQFAAYPPMIECVDEQGRGYSIIFPYAEHGIEYIVSQCIKVAAERSGIGKDDLFRQTFYDLQGFPHEANRILVERMYHFIQYLSNLFKKYNWYDEYGSCPWRFSEFIHPTFDLCLRRS